MIERMLTAAQAAKRYGVSVNRFRKLVKDRTAPQPISYPDGKRSYWDVQDIDQHLDQLKGNANQNAQSMDDFLERLADAP